MSCESLAKQHASYACTNCGNCDWHCACMVTAQHDETGYIWHGMRSRLPHRYSIVPEQSRSEVTEP